MSTQHLSDEAVAAFADDVLSGHARERASKHAMNCPECAHAVAVQREAVWALRSAQAPALPIGLLDRLRMVPSTTPLRMVPSAISPDGSAMFAAFGTVAAFVPPARRAAAQPDPRAATQPDPRVPAALPATLPATLTGAAVAAAGVVADASAGPTLSAPAVDDLRRLR